MGVAAAIGGAAVIGGVYSANRASKDAKENRALARESQAKGDIISEKQLEFAKQQWEENKLRYERGYKDSEGRYVDAQDRYNQQYGDSQDRYDQQYLDAKKQYEDAQGRYDQQYNDSQGRYNDATGRYDQQYADSQDKYSDATGRYDQQYGDATDRYDQQWGNFEEQYKNYKDNILPLEVEASKLGVSAKDLAQKRGEKDFQVYNDYYKPLQESLATDAMEGIDPQYERVSRDAADNVDNQFDRGNEMSRRALERKGVRPDSGLYEANEQQNSFAQSAARSNSMNVARENERDRVENVNFNRKLSALSRTPINAQANQAVGGGRYGVGSPGSPNVPGANIGYNAPGTNVAYSAPGTNVAYNRPGSPNVPGANIGYNGPNASLSSGASSLMNSAAGNYFNSANSFNNLANQNNSNSASALTGGITAAANVYSAFGGGGGGYGGVPDGIAYSNPAGGTSYNNAGYNVQMYADGGPVLSRGSPGGEVNGPAGYDQVPAQIDSPDGSIYDARLTDGEYVIPVDVVMAKGTDFFDKLLENGGNNSTKNKALSRRMN